MFMGRVQHRDSLRRDGVENRSSRAVLPVGIGKTSSGQFPQCPEQSSIFASRQLIAHHFPLSVVCASEGPARPPGKHGLAAWIPHSPSSRVAWQFPTAYILLSSNPRCVVFRDRPILPAVREGAVCASTLRMKGRTGNSPESRENHRRPGFLCFYRREIYRRPVCISSRCSRPDSQWNFGGSPVIRRTSRARRLP